MKVSKCNSNKAKSFLNKLPELIQGSSGLTQLGIGVFSGWCTGYLTVKVGKGAAIAAGGGILLTQIAYSQGIGGVDWTKIQQKSREMQEKLNKTKVVTNARHFSHTNTYFAAGFVGGFLIGVAVS